MRAYQIYSLSNFQLQLQYSIINYSSQPYRVDSFQMGEIFSLASINLLSTHNCAEGFFFKKKTGK